jgi:hypothetical protein
MSLGISQRNTAAGSAQIDVAKALTARLGTASAGCDRY